MVAVHVHIRRTRDADIAGIVSELKRLELDNAGFDAVIARVRSDSSIKQAEMHQIAVAYLGYDLAKSTPKGNLLKKITNKQMVTIRQHHRSENLGSFKPW